MSSFERFTCWEKDDVRDILDIEALHGSDSVFLATHSPVPMRRIDSGTDNRRSFSEGKFLSDLLHTEEDFQFIPVLGSTGVGKSHLVRWLSIHLNRSTTDSREVLLIPKSGTNLRDILQRILSLPGTGGEEFEEYRDKVERVNTSIDDETGRKRLLDELALAVEKYNPFEGENLDNLTDKESRRLEREDRFKGLLPKLLRDVYMRENCWLRDGGVIERFYDRHIGESPSEGEEVEFDEDDLPLDLSMDTVRRNAPEAFKAFKMFDGRRGDEFKEAAVHILSDCLDRAIRRFHNFEAQNLYRMTLDVRRALRRKGIDLILLIEDIAAVQGFDRQLIEAVQKKGEDLGRIQTVMGCTEGYYNRLVDTAVDRVDPYRVELDISLEEMGEVDLASFSARYLNAVRFGEKGLKEKGYDGGEEDEIASWCEKCEFQKRCHEAFGQKNGMGLYPFNEEAIRQMYEYIDPDQLNPRILIRTVLRHTLLEGKEEIEDGDFPSASLHKHFLGQQESELTTRDRRRLRRRVPDEEIERWKALLDLWSDRTEPSNFPGALHEVFDIAKIEAPEPGKEEGDSPGDDPSPSGVEEPPTGDGQPVSSPKGPSPESTSSEDETLQRDLKDLDKWVEERKLPQQLARELRQALHSAIEVHIDWDALGLSQSFFCGKSNAPFQSNSIQFEDSMGGREASWVEFTIPLDNQNRTDVAFALQGYRQFREHGHWQFSDDPSYLREFLNCLDVWAEEVVDQLQKTTTAGERWDPSPMAAELLAVGARLHGRSMDREAPIDERLNAIVADFEAPGEDAQRTRSKSWLNLAETLRDHQDDLRSVLEAHTLCLKGRGQTKIYDVTQFSHVLSSLEEGELKTELPTNRQSDFRDKYADLRSCYRSITRKLEGAIEEETDRYREWHEEVARHLGGHSKISATTEAVDEVLWEARGAAPGMKVSQRNIENLSRIGGNLRSLCEADTEDENGSDQKPPLEKTFETVNRVVELDESEGSFGRIVSLIGRDESRPMELVQQYIEKADELLETARDRVQNEVQQKEGIAGGIEETLQGIRSELKGLNVLLQAIETPSDFDESDIDQIGPKEQLA